MLLYVFVWLWIRIVKSRKPQKKAPTYSLGINKRLTTPDTKHKNIDVKYEYRMRTYTYTPNTEAWTRLAPSNVAGIAD